MDNEAIAEALFAAFTAGDPDAVRALCNPELVARQNGGPVTTLDQLIAFSGAVYSAVKDFRYEEPIRSATSAGFVEEHYVCGELPDGTPMRFTAVVVGDVVDGKITELREYADTAAAAGLLDALR